MSQPVPMPPMDHSHPYWRIHLFLACVLGVVGLLCFATGALVPIGVVLIPLAIAWGVAAVLFGAYQRHRDEVNDASQAH